jgi:hypothetical protein
MADLSQPINRFYYGYLANTDAALELLEGSIDNAEYHLLECVREAFTAGARWQFHESAKLSPHIARFLEMCVLLGPDPGRDEWLAVTPHEEASNSLEDLPFSDADMTLEHAPF